MHKMHTTAQAVSYQSKKLLKKPFALLPLWVQMLQQTSHPQGTGVHSIKSQYKLFIAIGAFRCDNKIPHGIV